MGIVKKPSLKDCWFTDPLLHTPIFSNQMSRNRYECILRGLHFADNSAPNPCDKLWKLGLFLPEIQKQFEIRVNLGKFLCVDESLMPFHGRLGFRQYHPLKRARYGIKYFSLVDTETKSLSSFKIYLGKGTGQDSQLQKELKMGGATVVLLLQDHLQKNQRVVVDNWFNSPNLQES